MTAFSNYLENKLLDHSLGTGSYTMPTVYLALFTSAPSDSGGGTEVTGSGYARQAISFGAGASGVAANSTAETFTASGGNFGTIVAIGLMDASSSGNLLYHGSLTASKTINNGESIVFSIGNITVTLD